MSPTTRILQKDTRSRRSRLPGALKNVKRWRDGDYGAAWCAAGIAKADHQFHCDNGHLHLPKLFAASKPASRMSMHKPK
jgi:hypothetical protein